MNLLDCSAETVILLLSWAVDDDDLLLGLTVLRPSISNLLQRVSSVIIKCDGLLLKTATAFLFESETISLHITKCVDYYQVRQNNVRVSGIWNK